MTSNKHNFCCTEANVRQNVYEVPTPHPHPCFFLGSRPGLQMTLHMSFSRLQHLPHFNTTSSSTAFALMHILLSWINPRGITCPKSLKDLVIIWWGEEVPWPLTCPEAQALMTSHFSLKYPRQGRKMEIYFQRLGSKGLGYSIHSQPPSHLHSSPNFP